MIGAQAISGGLIALLLFGALVLIAAGALVGGLFLAFGGRKFSGALTASIGATVLAAAGFTLMRMFPSPIERHVVDLRPTAPLGLREVATQCVQNGSEEWCSASKNIRNLVIVLPDGEQRSFGATSLYAVFAGNELKRVAFMVEPRPDRERLSLLLDSEAKAVGRAGMSKAVENVLRRIHSNEVISADQDAMFEHLGYRVHVWLLPRHSTQEAYAVWYELFGQKPGATISSPAAASR